MVILQSHYRLNLGDNHRTHIAFYKALGVLVFNVYRDDKTFMDFVRPWMEILGELQVNPRVIHLTSVVKHFKFGIPIDRNIYQVRSTHV